MDAQIRIHGNLVSARSFLENPKSGIVGNTKAVEAFIEYFQKKGESFVAMFPSEDVSLLLRTTGLEIEQMMTALLPLAAGYAVTPVSHFNVGAVGQGKSGSLYFGANMEFSSTFIATSVHGEQSCICHAYIGYQDVPLVRIAVNASPCGHCRQFLNEYTDNVLVLVSGRSQLPLISLLPDPFGPKDLEISPFSGKQNPLKIDSVETVKETVAKEVIDAAVNKAALSFAPYSEAPSALAVKISLKDSKEGYRIFAGSYLEIAAYNPSFNPAAAALVLANFSGLLVNSDTILEWALAELPGGFTVAAQAKHIFETFAPKASFAIIKLKK